MSTAIAIPVPTTQTSVAPTASASSSASGSTSVSASGSTLDSAVQKLQVNGDGTLDGIPDSYSQEYNDILNHPYTQALLATKKYKIDHPYDIPQDQASFSLTAGTLAGPSLIAHTPLTLEYVKGPSESTPIKPTGFPRFGDKKRPPKKTSGEENNNNNNNIKKSNEKIEDEYEEEEDFENEIIVFYHLGGKLCGHQGLIHGGLLATLMDESLCRCGFPVLPNKLGVTASLNIQYLAPTPAESIVALHARCTKIDGRKATVKGKISVISSSSSSSSPNDYSVKTSVKGEALIIEPRWVSKIDTGHFSQVNTPAPSKPPTPSASKPGTPPATD